MKAKSLRGVSLAYLLSVMGLVLALMAPSVSAAQLGGGKSPSDDATEEADQDRDAEDEGDPSDWEAAGLISDTEYESPQFGYGVEWSTDWTLDLYYDRPEDDVQPVMSNEDDEYDTVYLAWIGEPDAASWAIVTGQSANRGGVDEEIDEWTDEDWMANQWAKGIEPEVLLTDTSRDTAAVLYQLVDSDADDAVYYTIYVAIYLDDYTLYLSYTAAEVFFEDGYAALEDVEIDGDPLFQFLDWDDIEDAIDEAA